MWPFKKKFTPGEDCFCQFLEEGMRGWKYHSKSLCHLEAPEDCKRVKRVTKYNAIPYLHGAIEIKCSCK